MYRMGLSECTCSQRGLRRLRSPCPRPSSVPPSFFRRSARSVLFSLPLFPAIPLIHSSLSLPGLPHVHPPSLPPSRIHHPSLPPNVVVVAAAASLPSTTSPPHPSTPLLSHTHTHVYIRTPRPRAHPQVSPKTIRDIWNRRTWNDTTAGLGPPPTPAQVTTTKSVSESIPARYPSQHLSRCPSQIRAARA